MALSATSEPRVLNHEAKENLCETSLHFKAEKFLDKVTLIPRIVIAAMRSFAILPIFGFMSLFYRSDFMDPKKITNKKTPVLLIHGSNANQRQWDFFRFFLKGKQCGHIFAVNLNDRALINDKKNISEYAQIRIAKKIDEIKKRYLKEGFELNEMILIGHSMGGLIAGEYALNHAKDVKVKTIITLNTPWYGSRLADMIYKASDKPQGAFLTTSPSNKKLREKLLKKERKKKIKIYTFSTSLDPLVRPHSSSLPISKENQMFSKIHDHYSVKLDSKIAKAIRDKWIIPNTNQA